jgi:membrane-associated phospholipid phosphatase
MKIAILLLVAVNTLIFPFFLTLLLLLTKKIKSFDMETNKERIFPYAFTILFYFFTLLRLYKEPIPPIIFNFIIGATLSVILAFLINFKWKISAHMIGIGGLIGALISVALLLEVYITPYIILGFIAAGILGTSRLILKAHTPTQIYVGFFLGLLCQFTIIYF